MKKIFTCISLAAATFMATTPAMAQQQKQISNQEKVAFVKAVVPAMLDQVKEISGIDLKSLANPNIQTVLSSPLFGVESALRASNPINIQPDSMTVNLSEMDIEGIPDIAKPIMANIKMTFADYKDYSITTPEGRTVNVKFPKKITASALGGELSCGLNFAIGDKKGLLPFSSLSVNLDLGSLEAIVGIFAPGIKSGSLIALTEKGTSNAYTYDITIGESLRGILGMMEITNLPNFQITVDMNGIQTTAQIKASVFGIISNAKLPMGDAVVYLNPKAAATGTMTADSTILTSYKEGTAIIDSYTKIIQSSNVASGKTIQKSTLSYEKESKDADWVWEGSSMNTLNANTVIDNNNLVYSILNGVIADLIQGNTKSFNMTTTNFLSETDSKGIIVSTLEVIPSMSGVQAAIATINIKAMDETTSSLEQSMSIKVTLPLKGNVITAEFTPTDFNAPAGILYITSNAMDIITDNETIDSTIQEVKVAPVASGLYVKNGKGNYVIVNMVGKVVATGIITNDEQFISIPNMPKGIYAISIDKSNTNKLRSVHKTTVKFAK